MAAERTATVDGKKIEEIYWAGRYPCYVDNRLSAESFDATVDRIRAGKQPIWKQ